MNNLVYVAAMKEEIEPLINLYKNNCCDVTYDIKTKTLKCKDLNVYFLITGIGKLNACVKVHKFLNDLKENLSIKVINIGSVGARGYYNIGDIVNIGKCYDGDFDLTSFDYEYYEVPGVGPYIFTSDSYFSKNNCYSLSKFLSDSETIKNDKNYVVDMELYGIAIVCNKLHIPFYSIKIVTDVSDGENSKKEHEETLENLSEKLCKRVYDDFSTSADS